MGYGFHYSGGYSSHPPSVGEIVCIVVVLAIVALLTARRFPLFPFWRSRGWGKLAEELGVNCDAYVIEGDLEGMGLCVRAAEEERGTKSVRITQYEVSLRGCGVPPMRLRREHRLLGFNLDEMAKSTEIEIGFGKLDDAFIINGADEDAIREFFKRPGVASALLHLVNEARGSVSYHKGALRIRHDGIASQKRLRRNVAALMQCAKTFAKAGRSQLDERIASREEAQEPPEAKFGW